jgi:hypothetical protein
VATFTVTLPLAFAGTEVLPGLKLQEEFAGSELHAKVKVPLDPLRGVNVKVYVAACQLETVLLD